MGNLPEIKNLVSCTKHQINHYTYSDALIRQPDELGYKNNNNNNNNIADILANYRRVPLHRLILSTVNSQQNCK